LLFGALQFVQVGVVGLLIQQAHRLLTGGALGRSLAQGVCQQPNCPAAQQQQSPNRQRVGRREWLEGRVVVAWSVRRAGRGWLIRA
jgi:hypothetical protein